MICVPVSSAFRTLGLVVLSLLYALNMQHDRTESSVLSIEIFFFANWLYKNLKIYRFLNILLLVHFSIYLCFIHVFIPECEDEYVRK